MIEFTHVGLPGQVDELEVRNGEMGRFYKSPVTNLWYPSITTVLSAQPNPHLDEWKARVGEDAVKKEMRHATMRGDRVHKLAEDYLNNKKIDLVDLPPTTEPVIDVSSSDTVPATDDINIANKIANKMFKQMRFVFNRINNICAQEVALFSDIMEVAGRVDCIGEIDGVLSVIDFKTSRNVKTSDMIANYWKQCTFYALAYEERYGVRIDDLCIVMGVENSAVPFVFKSTVDEWIEPLVQSIHQYREVANRLQKR